MTRLLAQRHHLTVYDGDAAEANYIHRCDQHRQPHMTALLRMSPIERATGHTAEEVFASMPSRHGETFPFVLEDLQAMTGQGTVLADDFRTRPAEIAPLLTNPEHAVFLLPTSQFRRRQLTERYADPARAKANWGNSDHQKALEIRLARDHYWDQETRTEAAKLGLTVIDIDGTTPPTTIANELTTRFNLT